MGKYTITLSNGSTSFDVYDLEKNGIAAISSARKIELTDLASGAGTNFIKVLNDLTYRFVPSQTLTISNSAGNLNDGVHTVLSSSFDGTHTIIILSTALTTAALPFGNITYSVPGTEVATSLILDGKGTIGWGEDYLNNFVHALENFSSPIAPSNPVIGQLWYKSDTDELFKYTSGLVWSNDINLGTADLTFIDPQHPTNSTTPSFVLSGSDSDVGISIKALTDPASGDAIFRILSNNDDERLRIEHDGVVSTTNSLDVKGTTINNLFANNIEFPNNKGIISATGASISPDISGNTWEIKTNNSAAAPLKVQNSVSTTLFQIRSDNVVESIGDFAVNGMVLYVNSGTSRVGIGTNAPSKALDIVGDITYSSQLLAANGSSLLPSISFANSVGTGIKLLGVNDIEFVSNNTSRFAIRNTGLLQVDINAAIISGYESLVLNDDDVPNKKYVDDTIGTAGGAFVQKIGDTMSGNLNMTNTSRVINLLDPVNSQDAMTKNYADINYINTSGDTMTGVLTLNADPINPLEAATKQYVDNNPPPLQSSAKLYFFGFGN